MTRIQLLKGQGIYFMFTGLWPLIHMASFEVVTGSKVDDWLVKMVGLLAFVIGGTLFLAAQRAAISFEIVTLAIGSALAFTAIDVWYALSGRISAIYLADAVVEIALVTLILRASSNERS